MCDSVDSCASGCDSTATCDTSVTTCDTSVSTCDTSVSAHDNSHNITETNHHSDHHNNNNNNNHSSWFNSETTLSPTNWSILGSTNGSDRWYQGERIRDGATGWFPGNFTEEVNSPHVRARNLKQRYRLLTLTASYLEAKKRK